MDKELEKAFEELKKEWNKFLINFNNHSYFYNYDCDVPSPIKPCCTDNKESL